MSGWEYLSAATACATLFWLVARWSLRSPDGRVDLLGFWAMPSAIVVSLIVWTSSDQPLFQPQPVVGGTINGALAGVAQILSMTCVKIGPIGPTATVGNLAFVWPVAVVLASAGLSSLNVFVGPGLALLAIGLLVLGWQTRGEPAATAGGRRMSPLWFALALGAFFTTGAGQITQMTNAATAPENPGAFMLFTNVLVALVMFVAVQFSGEFRVGREIAGGLVQGLLGNSCLFLTLRSLALLKPHLVFPVLTATPIVVTLIVGWLFYNERFRWPVWVALTLLTAGLLLVAFSRSDGG